jgi:hypothetical protein
VLVELTPDIHICGVCKQQFNNLDAFVAHKQSGCQLTSTSGTAPSTVQFVSEETLPTSQAQTAARTSTSETQTITGTAGVWLEVSGASQTPPWNLLKRPLWAQPLGCWFVIFNKPYWEAGCPVRVGSWEVKTVSVPSYECYLLSKTDKKSGF